MQSRLAEFERGGVAVFAVSYDAVDVLAGFAEKHSITYPLLSDADSAAIRSLGLLNEDVAEQQMVDGVSVANFRRGIPHPGAFVLDENGVIVEKRFEQSYRHRPIAADWAEEFAGAEIATAISARAEDPALRAIASLDTAFHRPYQQMRLHVDLEVADGLHIYGAPIPDGYTALSIEIGPLEGLNAGPANYPEPQPFRVEGLDEEFLVHRGRIEALIPFSIDGTPGDVTLAVTIRYQACSEVECFPPTSLRITLPLPGQDLVRD